MTSPLPDFLTHYSRGEPFRSITSADPSEWPAIVAGLSYANTWGLNRFADPHYLPRRAKVEADLRAEFVARGGTPRVDRPSYFVLGRLARWEAQTRPGMRAYLLPLAAIPAGCLGFTFGDSLVCRDPDYRRESAAKGRYLSPLCGGLCRLEDLADLRARVRAEDLRMGEKTWEFEEMLEAQLWLDPPREAIRVEEIGAAAP